MEALAHMPLKIMVVDDDATNRLILKKILSAHGEVLFADNGDDAIALFTACLQKNAPIDLIFLDILMPGLDGRQVLAQIRSLEQQHEVVPGSGVKVVMVTSADDEENVFESHIIGCEGYLNKPYTHEQVSAILAELGFV